MSLRHLFSKWLVILTAVLLSTQNILLLLFFSNNSMYSAFQLAGKFFRYYLTASNGSGHGIHSPFVFSFIKNVMNDKKQYPYYKDIEAIRKEMLKDNRVIEVQDFGAGSSVIKTNNRVVKKMAASSLKPKKYAQLLSRIVQSYQPQTILELGTSFGITTAYLASGNKNGRVFTCEGAASIATIAGNNFRRLGLQHIILTEGDFAQTLPLLLNEIKQVDLGFIDGNHRKEPTLDYFNQLLKHIDQKSILIFDDIHWSREMEAAWNEIKSNPSVTCSIDLFFIGLVFFNPDFKVKQDFAIRF